MKRKFITSLLICLLLFSINLKGFAQKIPSNVISISQSGNSITLSFNLPEYNLKDTSVLIPYGVSEVFKYIDIDNFGIIDDTGYPQLPQLTVDLSIPQGASNFQFTTSNTVTQNISLNRKFLPTQEDIEIDSTFQINNSYYNSNGSLYNFTSQLSDPYIVFGANGISFSIFPFTYNPQLNRITVLKQAKFTITYSISRLINNQSDYSSKDSTSTDYTSAVTESYLSSFFDNYESTRSGSNVGGRYLIITAPSYESTITYFANYKRNIGYTVTVVNTNTTGTSASNIKNYIQTRYNNTSTRPDFVLLVGDHGDIPASGGATNGDYENPLTDLNYALLAGDDYFADVFLGRFSVSTTAHLQNIINKTIFMETNLHRITKRAVLLAGGGSGQNQFDNPHKWVIKNVLNPLGIGNDHYYAVDGATQSNGLSALNGNYTLFIYRGHGSQTSLGSPFSLTGTHIDNSTNTIFPFGFGFACLTNSFAYSSPCFGERWIRSPHGGVSYFGATTTTYRHTNNVIEERVLEKMKNKDQLSPFINLGMKDYYKRFWSWLSGERRKRHMKSYNLLGDPSLLLQGIGCQENFIFANNEVFNSGDVITYQANNTIQNNASFEVRSGANVNLVAGNAIILKPGFHAQAGSNFTARIEPCNNTSTRLAPVLNEDNTEPLFMKINNGEFFDPTIFSFFPNPTSADFSVSYTVNDNSFVKIELYDMAGHKIRTLLELDKQQAGNYYHNLSIPDLMSGTYLLVFSTELKTITGKIIKL